MPMLRSPTPETARGKNNSTVPNSDIQCSQCCVVINELLSFISNKVDTLPETAIIQICTSAYGYEEIEAARTIVYKLLTPSKKLMRRKEGSEQKSLQEIIKLIKETEPESLPCFVAKNLNKLPPVTFDHIDVTTFLKEMTLLKNDVANMKAKTTCLKESSKQNADIEYLRQDIVEVKRMISCLQEIHQTSQSLVIERNVQNKEATANALAISVTPVSRPKQAPPLAPVSTAAPALSSPRMQTAATTIPLPPVELAPIQYLVASDNNNVKELNQMRRFECNENNVMSLNVYPKSMGLSQTAKPSYSEETWLLPHDLNYINEINSEYSGVAKSSVDTSTGILRGRPYGGLAILWNKNKFPFVTPIQCANNRLAAVRILIGKLISSESWDSPKTMRL
ncbi:unnamed protein product [Colias eurytheme]|nr:unnamed protein product [Colias eurytheme]